MPTILTNAEEIAITGLCSAIIGNQPSESLLAKIDHAYQSVFACKERSCDDLIDLFEPLFSNFPSPWLKLLTEALHPDHGSVAVKAIRQAMCHDYTDYVLTTIEFCATVVLEPPENPREQTNGELLTAIKAHIQDPDITDIDDPEAVPMQPTYIDRLFFNLNQAHDIQRKLVTIQSVITKPDKHDVDIEQIKANLDIEVTHFIQQNPSLFISNYYPPEPTAVIRATPSFWRLCCCSHNTDTATDPEEQLRAHLVQLSINLYNQNRINKLEASSTQITTI